MTDGPGTALYAVAPWVVVRTPLLPASARDLVRKPRRALDDANVVRALAIGSPTLLAAALKPDADPREAARTDRSLARYLIRMSTRPTPYGAFAAVSLARWADRTRLGLGDTLTTRTRPDMGWLVGLLDELGRRPEVRARRRWRADPLAHEAGGRIVAASGGSVKATDPARAALAEASGWTAHADLVERVSRRTGGTPEVVAGMLDGLRAAGLLLGDLTPSLTGRDAASGLDALALVADADPTVADAMQGLGDALHDADAAPAADARAAFARVREQAGAVREHPETFQTDLTRDLAADELAQAIGTACARAAEVLLRLGPAPGGSADLASYTRAFVARYGSQREVPLAEVFDPVRGLGSMPHSHGGGVDAAAAARRNDTLLAIALDALRDGRRVIDLDEEACDALATWPPAPTRSLTPASAPGAPLSLDVSAFVVAPDAAAVARGDVTVVIGPNLGAASAGRWLGRFADMLGEPGRAFYEWLRDAEGAAEPASTDAEVVYVPALPRSGNVAVRPTVSPYEIVVSGRGSAPHILLLDDLLVGHDGRALYVRSRSLGLRLRPTARHMLNHHGAPPVCQFLDAVGRGGAVEFSSFDWGAAESLPVLPRVQVGRAVLAPARWLLALPRRATGSPASTDALETALADARRRWGLPDRVYVTVADNRLLLDLTEPDDVEQLRREVTQTGGTLRLHEALPDVGDAWLPGPGGGYLSELVVSLVRRPLPSGGAAASGSAASAALTSEVGSDAAASGRPPNGYPAQRPTVDTAVRLRLPGSDWLFAKFYAPADALTRLLTAELADLLDMAENSGLARRWFFLRYSDPEPHLRVRWQGDADGLLRHLLPQVNDFAEQLAASGRISRLVLDTYDREIERYAGPVGTDLVEDVFCVDSRAARRLLTLPHDATEVAVVSTAALLRGLGLDADARLALYERHAALSEDRAVSRAAGEDYRGRKGRLRALLGADPPPGPLADELASLIAALAPVGARLRAAEASGELTSPLVDVWPSLVHMHHNRLVGPGQAPDEARLHHLLLRTEKGLRLSTA